MRTLLISLVALACVACEPYKPSDTKALDTVDNMTFVTHRNGLCFGVVRFHTYAGYEGTSITQVSPEACR